jgi:hypothetical protein
MAHRLPLLLRLQLQLLVLQAAVKWKRILPNVFRFQVCEAHKDNLVVSGRVVPTLQQQRFDIALDISFDILYFR